jgi:hypothetical protein
MLFALLCIMFISVTRFESDMIEKERTTPNAIHCRRRLEVGSLTRLLVSSFGSCALCS